MSPKTRLACLLFALAAFSSRSGVAQPSNAGSLVGAWELTLIPNAVGTAAVELSIPGLATFTSDRTVIADVGQIARTPLSFTTGHGIWQLSPVVGHFFVRTISVMTNPNATLRAKRILTMTVQPNAAGDQFHGGYAFEVVDAMGDTLFASSGAVTGMLIPHPLLP